MNRIFKHDSLQCRRDGLLKKSLPETLLTSLRASCQLHICHLPLILDSYPVQQVLLLLNSIEKQKFHRFDEHSGTLSHQRVFRVVKNRLKFILKELFGGSRNQTIFLRYLKHFIGMQFGSSMDSRTICNEFILPDGCDPSWFAYTHGVIHALFSGLVVYLLRKSFRWCAINQNVPTVIYFSRVHWMKITQMYIAELIGTNLEVLPRHSLSGGSTVSSNARLVCKTNQREFRFVVNANRRFREQHSDSTKMGTSVNTRLREPDGLCEFLSRLRNELPSLYRPSLLSVREAYNAIQTFQNHARTSGHNEVWIASLDLSNCFHCVEHKLLLTIFAQVCHQAQIFMYPKPDIDRITHDLQWFLQESVVSFEGRPYRFQRGLPQGCCVSTELVNLYLAHADRRVAKRFPGCLLNNLTNHFGFARYLDDYFCFGFTLQGLQQCIDGISEVLALYGMTFNRTKMNSNTGDKTSPVVWLGMEIQSDLFVTIPHEEFPVFCRYAGRPMAANRGLLHFIHSRLRCVTWHFAFASLRNNRDPNVPSSRMKALWLLNARRVGQKIAHAVWIAVKTSPERRRLTTPPLVHKLAGIVTHRLRSLVGVRNALILRVAVYAFIERLGRHRGELCALFRSISRISSSFPVKSTTFLPH